MIPKTLDISTYPIHDPSTTFMSYLEAPNAAWFKAILALDQGSGPGFKQKPGGT